MYAVFLVAFLVTAQFVEATTLNFSVEGGEEVTRKLSLAVEDRVLIKFVVVAVYDKSLHFYMSCPNGTVCDFGSLGSFQYSFVCGLDGDYVLHFSNVGSNETKHVTLEYEIDHYIFGVPQMLFLTIVIVVVCVCAVAAFILMGKSR